MRVLSKYFRLVFLLGIFGAVWHAPLSAYPAPADKQAIVKVDQAFVEAVEKQDQKVVAAILDTSTTIRPGRKLNGSHR